MSEARRTVASGGVRVDAQILDDIAAEESFTGVVCVDTGDERVFDRSYGFAHRALAVPNTDVTRFAIASGGKAFTRLP